MTPVELGLEYARGSHPAGMRPMQQAEQDECFDVIVIGAGLSGTILGAILARHGQRVLIVEKAIHPRFAIGESLILEASESFRMLAEAFDVPEVAHYSAENCLPLIGSSHGIKKHFGFLYHRPGREQEPRESLQVVIPAFPYSHELHIYRQDCDAYYLSVAVRYGARVLQGTEVQDIAIDADGVRVDTDAGRFRGACIADASGHGSRLAHQLDLRTDDLATHSRSIFTHMVGVPGYHEEGPPRDAFGVPYPWTDGSLHHVFEGGWFWVIPFNNHPGASNPLCSVGLTLDPRVHPLDEALTPEQEFRAILGRYPSIERHLGTGRPVRDWVRTGRIQYGSKRVVGDRFCLLGHTAGFVDPLFSKGIYTSLTCVSVAAQRLLLAKREGDYSAGLLAPLEEVTQRFLGCNDRLIAHAFKSWCHHELWHAYAVLWLLGAYLELYRITIARLRVQRAQASGRAVTELLPELAAGALQGGSFAGYDALAEEVHGVMEGLDVEQPGAPEAATQELRRLYAEARWIPDQYRQIARGKNHTPRRKFTHRILLKPGGILGKGAFREHFTGDLSTWDVGRFLLRERWLYSRRNLSRQRRRVS